MNIVWLEAIVFKTLKQVQGDAQGIAKVVKQVQNDNCSLNKIKTNLDTIKK